MSMKITQYTTVHGKILVGENFGKPYGYKLLARKNLENKLKSVHMPNTFSVYLNIFGEENFGE